MFAAEADQKGIQSRETRSAMAYTATPSAAFAFSPEEKHHISMPFADISR